MALKPESVAPSSTVTVMAIVSPTFRLPELGDALMLVIVGVLASMDAEPPVRLVKGDTSLPAGSFTVSESGRASAARSV